MDITGLGSVFDFGLKVIEKFFPDPTEKAAAQARLIALHQQGELSELEIRMSAIIAEAKSNDRWTSRARPSFMYVMYAMILFAIPMGILSAAHPDMAKDIAAGMRSWLSAIPDGLWATFGIGYTGYSAARSYDKAKRIGKG